MSVTSDYNSIANEELIENIKAFCSAYAYTKDSIKSQILHYGHQWRLIRCDHHHSHLWQGQYFTGTERGVTTTTSSTTTSTMVD